MVRYRLAALLILTLMASATAYAAGSVVLPNPRLIACVADRAPLWAEMPTGADAIYPTELLIDIDAQAQSGLTALYDKSTSSESIRAAIEKRHPLAKLAVSPEPWTWRSESERVAVSLSSLKDGTKQVIYLAFQGPYSKGSIIETCQAPPGNGNSVVLPTTRLIGCKTADCLFWFDGQAGSYPKQLVIGLASGTPTGLVVSYSRPVSGHELRAMLNARYGKAKHPAGTKAWQLEAEQLLVSVSSGLFKTQKVVYWSAGQRPMEPHMGYGRRNARK